MAPSVPPKSYLEQLIAYRIAARWHIPSIADALPLTDQPFPEKHFARVFLAKLDKLAEVEPDVGIAREKIRSAMSKRLATRCATQKFGYVITADLTNVLKDYGKGLWEWCDPITPGSVQANGNNSRGNSAHHPAPAGEPSSSSTIGPGIGPFQNNHQQTQPHALPVQPSSSGQANAPTRLRTLRPRPAQRNAPFTQPRSSVQSATPSTYLNAPPAQPPYSVPATTPAQLPPQHGPTYLYTLPAQATPAGLNPYRHDLALFYPPPIQPPFFPPTGSPTSSGPPTRWLHPCQDPRYTAIQIDPTHPYVIPTLTCNPMLPPFFTSITNNHINCYYDGLSTTSSPAMVPPTQLHGNKHHYAAHSPDSSGGDTSTTLTEPQPEGNSSPDGIGDKDAELATIEEGLKVDKLLGELWDEEGRAKAPKERFWDRLSRF